MGCGCGGNAKPGIKVNIAATKTCVKCGWVVNRVFKFSQVTRKMIEIWICSNLKCKHVEGSK